jgi:hypothetical protein
MAGIAKILTWLIWLIWPIQRLLAITLMGVTAYMVDQFREHHFKVLSEVVVPLVVASVLEIVLGILSIATIFFTHHVAILLPAFFDFAIFVLYLTSTGLLRHNLHVDSVKNPLRNSLDFVRAFYEENPRTHLNGSLVKVLVDFVVIQIILFFITMILNLFVARRRAT